MEYDGAKSITKDFYWDKSSSVGCHLFFHEYLQVNAQEIQTGAVMCHHVRGADRTSITVCPAERRELPN